MFCGLSEDSPASCGFCGLNHKGATCSGQGLREWPDCPYRIAAPQESVEGGEKQQATSVA